MNKKSVKRSALFMSVLSLLLCVSMLVGTTFAWFTDEVESGMNTIAAGNLDIELYHTSASVTTEEAVNNGTTLFLDKEGNAIKWEPGVVAYENLRIANVGSLALNYELTMNIGKENDLNGNKLSEVLKIGFVDGSITTTNRADVVASVDSANWTTLADFVKSGSLLPEAEGTFEQAWGVVIWWEPTDDDNKWNANNGKEVSDFAETKVNELYIELGVKLTATQMMYEEDSFDETYDNEATFVKVSSTEELATALAAGETNIYLNPGNYDMPNEAKAKNFKITGTRDAVITMHASGSENCDYNLDGSSVDFKGITLVSNGGYARSTINFEDCAIKGGSLELQYAPAKFVDCDFTFDNAYLWTMNSTQVDFVRCTFNTNGKALLVYSHGTATTVVNITDCEFNATAAAYTWNGKHVAAVSIDATNATSLTVNFYGTNTAQTGDNAFASLWQIKGGEDKVVVTGA